MYLRHTTRRKDGEVHTYWRLVCSVRVGRTVRQQTVAHLGELDAQGRGRAKALAQAITGGRCGWTRCWSGCCPTGGRGVPWATMAAVLVLARLCEPSSELRIAEDWYRRTVLEDRLALAAPLVNDDRLYRSLDRLLPHKRALERIVFMAI